MDISERITVEQADKMRRQAVKHLDTWWCGEDLALELMRKHKVFEYWDIEDLMYRPIDYDELNEWLEWAYEDYWGEDL